MTQEKINELLVERGRRGQRVVRLKGGDPFVLGRGGEEALALVAAGVPFEVVPGVSSAVAAPALAGIPVTHRGLSAGFAVVSGHAESAWQPVVDAVPPGALTLVVLMGLGSRAALATRLIDRGWPRTTPAAVVWSASRPQAGSWRGTLATLAQAGLEEDAPESSPGTIVIGDVVSLQATLAPAVNPPAAAV